MGTHRHTQTHWDAHTGQVSLILPSTRLTPETLSAVVSTAPPPPLNESGSNQCVPDGPVLCAVCWQWVKGVVWDWGDTCLWHHSQVSFACLLQSHGASPGLTWPHSLRGGVDRLCSLHTPHLTIFFAPKCEKKVLSTSGFFHLHLVRLLFSGFPSHSSSLLFCSHLCLF